MIRALLCDLDGTLFLDHGKSVFDLSERNRKAMAALREAGIAVYPDSGRMASFGSALLKHLGFDDIISAGLNGAAGIDNGNTAWRYDISAQSVKKALNILACHGVQYRTAQIQTMDDMRIFPDLSLPDVSCYRAQAEQTGVGTVSKRIISEFLEDPGNTGIGKLSVRFNDSGAAVNAMKLLQDEMADCYVTMSDTNLVDVMSPGADKANLNAYLIGKRGYRKEETAAVGDGLNDLSMLKNAGLSFAMEHGNNKLKETADHVVQDVCACCELILNRKIGD